MLFSGSAQRQPGFCNDLSESEQRQPGFCNDLSELPHKVGTVAFEVYSPEKREKIGLPELGSRPVQI